MSKIVTLTGAEIDAAGNKVLALHRQHRKAGGAGLSAAPVVDVVRAVVEGINKMRQGDPEGTIRRSPNGLVVERRTNKATGQRYWHRLLPEGERQPGGRVNNYGRDGMADADTWELLYRPVVAVEPITLQAMVSGVQL